MSAFVIKIIAVTAMLLDHVQVVFPDTFPIGFRFVGRLAFPLFAYLIAESFRYTRSSTKFLTRLLLFAVISEPFFRYTFASVLDIKTFGYVSFSNIFFTLFLGGVTVAAYKHFYEKHNLYCIAAVSGCLFLGAFLGVDYGWVGVLFVFCMYAVEKKHTRLTVMAVMCLLIWFPVFAFILIGRPDLFENIYYPMILFTLFSVPIAALYNGKRGYQMKWVFYIFYPLHIAVLGGVLFLLNR
jgi:hypothetical protein